MPVTAGDPHVAYVLRHADDNLVLAQRLGEWISRAPELEEDIALANIGLDHLGQARALLMHAGALEGAGRSEDDLAMLRDERSFTNLLLVEQPNGDFAHTMVRALFFDAYQVELWEALTRSTDPTLAGIAAKALKETRYHLRHSSTWMIRLGDGTDESHTRAQRAVDQLWRFTAEPFEADETDAAAVAAGWGPAPGGPRRAVDGRVRAVLDEATLECPPTPTSARVAGRIPHRAPGAPALRDAVDRPLPSGAVMVTASTSAVSDAVRRALAGVVDPEIPGPDDRGHGHPAWGDRDRARRDGDHHAHLLGVSGDGPDPRRHRGGTRGRRRETRRGRDGATPPPGPPTG
jgi:ring-1,2-phenylacetyl-CoA epoxidase subunit PaaC